MNARTDTNTAPVGAFLAGSLLGVMLGLLFAPTSGKESRELLRQQARANVDKMKRKVQQGRDAAATAADEAVDTTQAVIARGEESAADAGTQLEEMRPRKRNP